MVNALGGQGGNPAQMVVQGLIARGVPPAAAYGIAGNLSVESGFDSGINEIAPLVPGSRGGYGLAQWTGPRRRELEAFASERGAPVSDMDLQLDFLMREMQGSERGNAADTLAAATPQQAAYEFMDDFLRPGIPHADRRMEEAAQLAGMPFDPNAYAQGGGNALAGAAMAPGGYPNASGGMPSPYAPPPPPPPPLLQFADAPVAAPTPRRATNALDPRGFSLDPRAFVAPLDALRQRYA